MVDMVEKIGDAFGVVWALFQDETGQLTLPALLLLAALALATAARCGMATLPAREAKMTTALAVGSGFTLIFGLVGVYFLVQVVLLGLE